MKAIQFEEHGPPEVLNYVDLPDPVPGAGQVLVRVRAVGVNFHDNRYRLGITGSGLPGIPGLEMAGEVVATDVSGFAPGDRVVGRVRRSYAELVAADAVNLFHIPERLTFEQAAVIPVGFLTATHALLLKSPIQPGERLLVQAAGSSVGSAAIQLAKALPVIRGDREPIWVVGTAGTDDRCARTLALGADAAINYTTESVPDRVMNLTGGSGVDVALDGVGSSTMNGSITSLAAGGRVLAYGAASGDDTVTLRIGDLAGKGASLVGFSITAETALFRKTMATFRDRILPRFSDGTLTPMLEGTLPLRDAAEAHRSILERKHFGKIALIP